MKRRFITLFVGIIHIKNAEEDVADIRFITTDEKEAKEEMLKVKDYGIQILKLECTVQTETYIFLKSLDGISSLESFYIERILIIKGDNQ